MSKKYFHNSVNTIDANTVNFSPDFKNLNVLSLFSGAGGMDLGFQGDFDFLGTHYEKNPFSLVFANDIFKQAADVYEDNFNHQVERRSVDELTFDEIDHQIEKNTNKPISEVPIDVILGGFPCQTFSYAGKRGGLSDPRGQLYRHMIRIIEHYNPKMFIAENVDGIRNSRKNDKGDKIERSALDIILDDFDKAGYNVQYNVLNSADYGVPQTRRRVIIMGIRKDLGDISDQFYPAVSFDETGLFTGKMWKTSKDGIDDIWDKVNSPTIANHTTRDISKAKFYPGKRTQGNNKIDANRPAPTIRAEHHGNIEAHYRSYDGFEPDDMQGWRRLSVRECARLQSFPDSFIFTTSASSAYKAIGNAVPPVMAWNIARSVAYTLSQLEN
ncbi:DNA (cytosine-5)-methyltransferase 1 [Granulicatella balaenopterae]|uniref:Cytosine-specific methyltransferase n=1 Tax=Granulicatella balaenopterae TaxID=137733 RepID=A0A1H9N687_9LACT|nr:DNA (cytosine-5)-methyltransferase 1 [Granulicatella balaenopterae]